MKSHFLFAALLLANSLCAQFKLSGKLSDETGAELVGASIFEKNSYKGTTSDFGGNYSLQLSAKKSVIVFRYIGYEDFSLDVSLTRDSVINLVLKKKMVEMGAFTVEALRNDEISPMAVENISKEALNRNNLGQDLPILLNFSPSLVSTSDAGAGVGYTGLRIRGSDASRVNVTINGIPLNDAESQGVFWVNMPDFASSVDNIQIQRGVGASTNGAGAFGASINLMTDQLEEKAYAEVANSFGSFNTRKHTLEFGSGRIAKYWNFSGRLSSIQSDGYIDRASSDLKSYYLSASYSKDKSKLKAIHFSGKERTYQAWWGSPEGRVNNDVDEMNRHADFEGYSDAQRANLLNSGRTYNYYLYENEVDDYKQDHYQLHWTQSLSEKTRFNLAGHYTFGEGFFEQYREADALSDYGFSIISDPSSDLIRRRWLRNHFFGGTFSLIHETEKLKFRWGGAYHYYDGEHFGEIVWLENSFGIGHLDRYYTNKSYKNDANSFVKIDWDVNQKTRLYIDLQGRFVDYSAQGPDNDLRVIAVDTSMLFFNPKFGINRSLSSNARSYLSYAVGHREPTRNDFIDALPGKVPVPEQLHDLEMGYEWKSKSFAASANAYFMYYRNQLVLTGELNDVGSPIRTNVDESYRAGIELVAAYSILKALTIEGNYTYSQNRITAFTEVIYDYTQGFDIVERQHSNTDISFSPSHIGMVQLSYFPIKSFEFAVLNKYVGRQYLDNTSDLSKSLAPYYTCDARIRYKLQPKFVKEVEFSLLVNNLWNNLYSSNGYTYSYIFGEEVTENFFYPQAGTNFLAGINFKF